jgi:hypothetical protein
MGGSSCNHTCSAQVFSSKLKSVKEVILYLGRYGISVELPSIVVLLWTLPNKEIKNA